MQSPRGVTDATGHPTRCARSGCGELFASSEDEQHEAHKLYTAIQAEITALDTAVARFRGAMVSEEVTKVARDAGR